MKIEALVRDNIKALQPYSSARDEFKDIRSDMVFVDANENPFNNGLNRYPDPQQRELKNELSELKSVDPNRILIGNGSDEVLDLIFRSFCEPNRDKIITLPPTYGMYKVLSATNAVINIEIPLDANFQPDVDTILSAQDENTKLLFLCSPNNPTANSLDSNKVKELIKGFRGIVVIDEAYIDFSKSESWIGRLEEFPNLIVIQTLSKAYGLAAIRLGICYASPYIISVLNKIKPPYNINQLTQSVALKALKERSVVLESIDAIIKERQLLLNQLKTIELVKYIYPTDANFILIKVDDANARYQQLIDKGIVVRNRTSQLGCENCLRITVGTKKENETLVNTLKQL